MKYTDICQIVTNIMQINILIRLDNDHVNIFYRDFKRKIFAGVGFDPLTIRPISSVSVEYYFITAIFGLPQVGPNLVATDL